MACATSVVKYLVFLFNLLCALAGLAFLAVGVIFKLDLDWYADSLSQDNADVPAIVLIVLGSIIFVISFFGCCGAVRESTCMLTTYAIFLLVLFILQVALGVYTFLQYKDSEKDLKTELKATMEKTFAKYNSNNDSKEIVDTLQQTLKCCGVDGYKDWNEKNWNNHKIVSSCCVDKPANCDDSSAFTKGCGNELWDYLKKSLQLIGIIALSIGAVEIIGAIVALCLSSSIRNEERRGYY